MGNPANHSPAKLLKARTRRPKHVPNDYWHPRKAAARHRKAGMHNHTITMDTTYLPKLPKATDPMPGQHLVPPAFLPIIGGNSVPVPHLGDKATWHPTKGIRHRHKYA